jgi:hypothetical protein
MPSQKPLKPPGAKGKHVARLNTPQGVRREMARLYTDARRGQLDTGDAYRLSLILAQLVKAIETSELADRLDALELLDDDDQDDTPRLRRIA